MLLAQLSNHACNSKERNYVTIANTLQGISGIRAGSRNHAFQSRNVLQTRISTRNGRAKGNRTELHNCFLVASRICPLFASLVVYIATLVFSLFLGLPRCKNL